MKKTLLLLFVCLFGALGGVKAWTSVDPENGKAYYLLNVEQNQYFRATTVGNPYGITSDLASATPVVYESSGQKFRFYLNKTAYKLYHDDGTPQLNTGGTNFSRDDSKVSGFQIYSGSKGATDTRRWFYVTEANGVCYFPKTKDKSIGNVHWQFIAKEEVENACATAAQLNNVMASRGWERVTSVSQLQANPENYTFAIYSANVQDLMVQVKSDGRAKFVTATEALANDYNLYEIQNYTYGGNPFFVMKSKGTNAYFYPTAAWQLDAPSGGKTTADDDCRLTFEVSSNGVWHVKSQCNYDDGSYWGLWTPTNGYKDGEELAGNKVEGIAASLLIYRLSKDITPISNLTNEGWTTEAENKVANNSTSTEGTWDGTNYLASFNQVWRWRSDPLDNGIYSRSFTTIKGGKYRISAWVRLYNENAGQTTYSGATMFAGDNSVSVCEGGTLYNENKCYLGQYNVDINAAEAETFNFGFKLEGANFNWLSFKNVNVTYLGETLATAATAFTSGNDATAGTWYAFSVPGNTCYMLSSTAAATLSYSQDGGKCVNEDDFSTLDLTKGASKCLILNEGTYYFKSDANTTLTITTPENGENVTKLIVNPSFELDEDNHVGATGWTLEDTQNDTKVHVNSGNYEMTNVDGTKLFNTWNGDATGYKISQTLQDVPAGHYKVAAVMAAFAGQTLQLKANDVTGTAPSEGKGIGVEVTTYVTLVNSGDLEISAKTADGAFYKVDNFRLTYFENDQVQTVSDAFTSGNATTAGAWKAVTVTEGNYMLTSTASATLSYTQDGEKSFSANDFSSVTLAAGVSKCITVAAGTLYFKSNAATTLTLTPFVENLNMTSCITNSDFESNLDGWTPGNFEIQSGNGHYSGKFAQMWAGSGDLAAGDLNQTLNLPAGTYTLTAKSWADISCHLYASIGGVKQELSYQTAEAVDRDLTFAVATTSDVVIGIYHEGKIGVTGSTWVSCDDFRLTYTGPYHEIIVDEDTHTQTYEGTFTEAVTLIPTAEYPFVDITGATFTGEIWVTRANPNGLIYATPDQVAAIETTLGKTVVDNVISNDGNVCESLVITDDYPFFVPSHSNIQATEATYSRDIAAASNFGTICVPFALTSNGDIQYYTTAQITDGVLKLTEVENVAAGVPAIFKKKNGEATEITVAANNVSIASDAGTNGSSVVLRGAFVQTVVGDINSTSGTALTGKYYIKNNQFCQGVDYFTVNPFRAYLEAAGKNARLTLQIDDEATAISELKKLDEEQGLKDGKYLIGGKIIVVKAGKQFNVNGVLK